MGHTAQHVLRQMHICNDVWLSSLVSVWLSQRERERERKRKSLMDLMENSISDQCKTKLISNDPHLPQHMRICITETLDNLAGRLVGQPDLRQNDRRAKTIRLPRNRKCEHSLSCGQRACARAVWTRHTWPRRQDGVESENQFSVAKQWALTQTGNVPTELETKEKKKMLRNFVWQVDICCLHLVFWWCYEDVCVVHLTSLWQ